MANDKQETTYLWGSFIWTGDGGLVTEVDPFHIKCWGKVNVRDEQNKPMTVVWCEISSQRVLTKRFYNSPADVELELNRIRNAKMRN